MRCSRRSGPFAARAYTLIEILVVVVVLGICAAVAIPSMSSASVLRAQAAVRTLVSDITYAQSDALAFQVGRAILFDQANNSWKICEVRSTIIDPQTDLIYASQLRGTDFGDSRITARSCISTRWVARSRRPWVRAPRPTATSRSAVRARRTA